MEQSTRHPRTPKPGKIPLAACLALFALFFVNLLVGKANIVYQLSLPHMGNLAEFLLVGAASTFLIVAALEREAAEKTDHTNQTEEKK